MKPWLFNLLACPICKKFPLNLVIFSFDTKEKEIKSYLESYKEKDLSFYKEYKVPDIMENGDIYLKDNIIIEKTNLENYLRKLKSILDELPYISDDSPYNISKEGFNLAKGEIKDKILGFLEEHENKDIKLLLPELIFLNRLLVDTEIETGLLFCDNCNRWFPIIDTIPRMLPDKYRKKEKDLEFLEEHKDQMEEHFLISDLKPFALDS